ncbi:MULTISPECIES: hypothetical protein [Streptomyces]|uniref:Uncharacterized protein n=1 Tax=Streptomyces changanensis TaxID=2964669 RepID=A0ABY5ND13_9ACTN|nr:MULTISPECIES: hypothetical protein [Streptomyces]UUS33918.1 hypothetical protein NRO40_25905 [Streptomyces changanensis]
MVESVGDELAGRLIEDDAIGAQFGGAGDAGDQRDDDDPGDEEGGDDDAVGLVDDVGDQGVEQDRGQQAEADGGGDAASRPAVSTGPPG